MLITKVPPSSVNWHQGIRYDVALGEMYTLNASGDRTKVDVYIRNRKSGKIDFRVGDGRQIGNLHPVLINWNGEKVSVEELLRSGFK